MATRDGPRRAPKYAALVETFRERFRSGRYAAGSTMPTEDELREELGVSRYTLREALRVLEDAGYIQRRRRAGTLVLSTSPRRPCTPGGPAAGSGPETAAKTAT